MDTVIGRPKPNSDDPVGANGRISEIKIEVD